MAVFPLENGVFSGTLLRFNVRGYVYIWSLIFSMFNFLWACCNLCVLIAIYAYSLYMLLIVGVFMRARGCVCGYVYLGKWGNGEFMGGMGDGGTGV